MKRKMMQKRKAGYTHWKYCCMILYCILVFPKWLLFFTNGWQMQPWRGTSCNLWKNRKKKKIKLRNKSWIVTVKKRKKHIPTQKQNKNKSSTAASKEYILEHLTPIQQFVPFNIFWRPQCLLFFEKPKARMEATAEEDDRSESVLVQTLATERRVFPWGFWISKNSPSVWHLGYCLASWLLSGTLVYFW